MRLKKIIAVITVVLIIDSLQIAEACTNFMVTKGASTDGSTMISYSADSHVLYGELYYKPATDYPENAMMKIIEWDSGKPLGEIKQVRHTYAVVGNMNEHQVAIGETTYGGREELSGPSGIIDYGSLMWIALQRAKSAREAIKVMAELFNEYGYASSGESFSVSDPDEVWIMEMIGKGKGEKGALWVAMMVPDGYVCAHANHARITTFPFQKKNDWFNKKQVVFHSPDVISFAKSKGWYSGPDKDFSFSDVYAPVDFGGARFCEMRVWAFFNAVNSEMAKYKDYAGGIIKHESPYGFASNRLPLWIKPDRKISNHDVMAFMRDYLQGTEFDMSKDFGAGPWDLPYRWRPLTFKVDGETYCNERATATQQTGFVFVAQARNWLPDPIGGVFWFGVDDANLGVFTPMYCGIKSVPKAYAEGNGSMLEFTWESAFWVFNWVANFTYSRYNYMVTDVRKMQQELENNYLSNLGIIDEQARILYESDKEQAITFLTDYSVKMGEYTVKKWTELGQYLMVKYIDGNIKKEKDGKFQENGYGIPVSPDQPGYPEKYLRKIAEDTGSKLKVLEEPKH